MMARRGTNPHEKEVARVIPVHLHGLGFDEQNSQPVVILKEDEGLRVVPIWIGHPEAMAIMLAVQGTTVPRPQTHDLLMGVIGATGFVVDRVEIVRVDAGTFYASLVLRDDTRTLTLDARPSDCLALAVRASCPVFVDDEVMRTAGIVPDDDAEQEVAAFRDFLEHVDPEDFMHS
jgi:bifunctional DNase/RNase